MFIRTGEAEAEVGAGGVHQHHVVCSRHAGQYLCMDGRYVYLVSTSCLGHLNHTYVHLYVVSCPRPYFSGIGSGNIAYIELFQWNSIIADVNT